MLYLACYDIENDRIRLKIANHLLALGYERIQKSVFVGMQKPTEKHKLESWFLTKFGATIAGNILLIPLSQVAAKEAWHLGKNAPDWEYLSNKIETLIF